MEKLNSYRKFEELIKKKGITSYQVSKATGITAQTISGWKHGKYEPKAAKLRVLAKYFGVTIEYFWKE